jgi:hypothetical protein
MKEIDNFIERYPLLYIATILVAALVVPALIEAYL